MRKLLSGAALVGWAALIVAVLGLSAATASPVKRSGDPGHGGLSITSEPFGSVGGQNVARYTLTNSSGMMVKILTYGGIIQQVVGARPDGTTWRTSRSASRRLARATSRPATARTSARSSAATETGSPGHASRSNGSHLPPADQQPAELAPRRHRSASTSSSGTVTKTVQTGDSVGLVLHLVSPDGDQGYPGNAAPRT